MRVLSAKFEPTKYMKNGTFFSHRSYSTLSVPFFLGQTTFQMEEKISARPPRYWLLLCFYHTEAELGEKCFFSLINPVHTNQRGY